MRRGGNDGNPAVPQIQQMGHGDHRSFPVIVHYHIEIYITGILLIQPADQHNGYIGRLGFFRKPAGVVSAKKQPDTILVMQQLFRQRGIRLVLVDAEPISRLAQLLFQPGNDNPPIGTDQPFQVGKNSINAPGRLQHSSRHSRQSFCNKGAAAGTAEKKLLLRQNIQAVFNRDGTEMKQFLELPRTGELLPRRKDAGKNPLPQLVRQQLIQRQILRGSQMELIPFHRTKPLLSALNLHNFSCKYYNQNRFECQQTNADLSIF